MLKTYLHFFQQVGRKIQAILAHPLVTVKYPEVVKPLPALAHTSLRNDFSECTGCRSCEKICPVNAIKIAGIEYSSWIRRPTTSKGIPFDLEVQKFQIDYNVCVLCGLCVQSCPTTSLNFSKNFLKPAIKAQNLVVDLIHVPRSLRSELPSEL
jgi:formate hydrogenlyase subunit 6/NADH:ubiquinone oxidoreductase subunit I